MIQLSYMAWMDADRQYQEWLEEREDEWSEFFEDADELVHYSDYVNNDNWKDILKRLAEEW